MNTNFRKLLVLWSLFAVVVMQSCSDDDNPDKPGEDGFFIVNEGGFGNGNTSISFYDRETDVVTNDVFAQANGRALGDQAQSMTIFEDKGYIVVQGSGKIEVIDEDAFTSIATITDGIENPRYFLGVSSSKGYVSDWGADGLTGTIKVIDLNTHKVLKSISTGKGPNRMIKLGNDVYVANSGGYGKDNTVQVINATTDAVSSTLIVGDNPNSLQLDSDGNIWVSSSGAVAYNSDFSINVANSTKGSISKISSGSESLRIEVAGVVYGGARNLEISSDGEKIYYLFDGTIYSMNTASSTLPSSAFASGYFYGLAVDPYNGNIIGMAAPSFSSSGTIEVMDAAGNRLNTYTVGIAPNGAAFD